MLPDRDLQLLTAYVDGEMNAREREQVARMLQKSAAARTVLQLLETDARRVRELTRLKLGPAFPAKVMRTLAQSESRPSSARRPPPAPAPWIGMTVAASIFVMIAAVSYWYFAPRHEAARSGADSLVARPIEDVLGRFGDRALHLAGADLATETTRKTLVTKLQQDDAYHVDLAVQDNGRAIQRLAAALNESGVQVVMGAGMQDSQMLKRGPVTYCLFADNLKPDELAGLLQQLGAQSASRPDARVNRVIVDVMTPEHRQRLSAFLGLVEKEPVPARQEARDPVADLVNKRIIAGDPAGQGTSSIKPKAPPPPARFALVFALPHGDLTGLGDSPELRTFMSKRGGKVPGTLQVFLVVHEARI